MNGAGDVRPDAEFVIAITTTASREEAVLIAREFLERRLIACANVIETVRSLYRWQGEICDETEVLMIMKTTRVRIDEIKERLPALHSYEVPELIVLPIQDGLPAYLQWAADCTSAGTD